MAAHFRFSFAFQALLAWIPLYGVPYLLQAILARIPRFFSVCFDQEGAQHGRKKTRSEAGFWRGLG
jgi:hypothetical protein